MSEEDQAAALVLAVRTGDVAKAAYLLEACAVSASAKDEFDSSPLFYASLCGQVECVKLLLKAGAKCERRTFDGERCLYAALNDATRRALLESGFKRGEASGHDVFMDVLENAFDEESTRDWRDVVFQLCDGEVEGHAAVLAARCPYLARRFLLNSEVSDGSTRHVRLRQAHFPAAALAALLRWCYTERLEVSRALALKTAKLAEQCGLSSLASALRLEERTAPPSMQLLALSPPRAAAKAALVTSLSALADACCDADAAAAGLPDGELQLLRLGAVQLLADDEAGDVVVDCCFHAPPMVLASRSEFFRVALAARWRSAGAADPLRLPGVSPSCLRAALRWACTDTLDAATPLPGLLALLRVADEWLIDALKQRTALLLVPHVSPYTAVPLLGMADAACTPRLGDACAAVVAEQLEELAGDMELAQLVRSSADTVRGRQLTDSIPLLDDIAFHVRRLHGPGGDLSDDSDEEGWTVEAAPPDVRKAAAETAAVGASSVRRRKAAILQLLAAQVQGWDVVPKRR